MFEGAIIIITLVRIEDSEQSKVPINNTNVRNPNFIDCNIPIVSCFKRSCSKTYTESVNSGNFYDYIENGPVKRSQKLNISGLVSAIVLSCSLS